jgi:hypothetical protein
MPGAVPAQVGPFIASGGRFSHSIVQPLQASICQIDHALLTIRLEARLDV